MINSRNLIYTNILDLTGFPFFNTLKVSIYTKYFTLPINIFFI